MAREKEVKTEHPKKGYQVDKSKKEEKKAKKK